jgi:hypothetical protein
LALLLGDKSGAFTPIAGIPVPGGTPQAVDVNDLNGDKKPELIWLDASAGTIRFLLQG